MSTADIILGIILIVFMYNGWKNGLIKKIISLIFLVISFLCATKFGASVGEMLFVPLGISPGLATVFSFFTIVLVVMIGQALLYKIFIKELVEGLWNKIGGVLVGIVEGGLLISMTLIFLGVYLHIPSEETRGQSILYKPLKNFGPTMYDAVNTFLPESEDFYQELFKSLQQKNNKNDSKGKEKK